MSCVVLNMIYITERFFLRPADRSACVCEAMCQPQIQSDRYWDLSAGRFQFAPQTLSPCTNICTPMITSDIVLHSDKDSGTSIHTYTERERLVVVALSITLHPCKDLIESGCSLPTHSLQARKKSAI